MFLVGRGGSKPPLLTAPSLLTIDHAAPLAAQVAAAAEEALSTASWCDVHTCLPSSLSSSDAATVLSKVKAVSTAAAAGSASVLAATCVVAAPFLDSLRQQLLEVARQAALQAHQQQKKAASGAAGTAAAAGGDGAKAGKKGGAVAAAAAESDDEDEWDAGRGKGKKGGKGRKGKGGGGGGAAKQQAGGGKGKGAAAGQQEAAVAAGSVLSVRGLADRVVQLQPELEAAGVDGELPEAIATELRPAVVKEYEAALHAIFTSGAERRRRLREAACAALEEAFPRLQAFAHGAELFAGDEGTLGVLHRHLLRSAAADCVDALLRYLAADEVAASEQEQEGQEGGEGAAGASAAGPLAPAERAAILKRLHPDVKALATTAVDKLNGSSLEVRTAGRALAMPRVHLFLCQFGCYA